MQWNLLPIVGPFKSISIKALRMGTQMFFFTQSAQVVRITIYYYSEENIHCSRHIHIGSLFTLCKGQFHGAAFFIDTKYMPLDSLPFSPNGRLDQFSASVALILGGRVFFFLTRAGSCQCIRHRLYCTWQAAHARDLHAKTKYVFWGGERADASIRLVPPLRFAPSQSQPVTLWTFAHTQTHCAAFITRFQISASFIYYLLAGLTQIRWAISNVERRKIVSACRSRFATR